MGIPDIEAIELNIHAGSKYMRWIVDRHFSDPGINELNRHLFALAAYNAGPNRVSRLRREATTRGNDPNQWFNHVEVLVRQRVGMESVRYVRNVYKYYLAYEADQHRRDTLARLKKEQGR